VQCGPSILANTWDPVTLSKEKNPNRENPGFKSINPAKVQKAKKLMGCLVMGDGIEDAMKEVE